MFSTRTYQDGVEMSNSDSHTRISLDADGVRDLVLNSIQTVLSHHSDYHDSTCFSRSSQKLNIENLVYCLFSMVNPSTDAHLADFFGYSELTPSASSFCEARQKLDPELFLDIFRLVMDRLSAAISTSAVQKGDMTFLAIDGSNIPLETFNKEEQDLARTRSDEKKRAGIHLNGLYTMNDSHMFLDFDLQRLRDKNEPLAARHLVQRQPENMNICFVLDRAYHCFELEHTIAKRGNYYLIRLKESCALSLLGDEFPNGEGEFDVHIHLTLTPAQKGIALKRRQNPDVRYHGVSPKTFDFGEEDEIQFDCRVVCVKITDEDGIEHFEYLITNLPESYTLEDLRRIYEKRWMIEVGYRDLKYGTGVRAIHSRKISLIEQEIYIGMLLHNIASALFLAAMDEDDRQQENKAGARKSKRKMTRRINRTFVLRGCRSFLFDPFLSGEEYIRIVCRHKVQVKGYRHFSRQIRNQVCSAQYR